MRHYLFAFLLVSACATPPPQRPQTTTQSRAQRWQPAPVRADGAYVPGGRRHVIKSGDTGLAIAIAYGVSWGRIAAANNIDRNATLYVGRSLFIPTDPPKTAARTTTRPPATGTRPAPSRPLTTEERAAAFDMDIDGLITGSTPAIKQAPPPPKRAATAATAARPATPPAPAAATNIPRLVWPVDGRVILSSFGPKPGGRFNDGVNIKTINGQAVRAAADGEVIYIGDAISSFGLLVLVRHPGGAVTAYGHLSDVLVDRGTKVDRGQTIARAGSSGSVNEPQLLFQVRQGRKAVNPISHLPS